MSQPVPSENKPVLVRGWISTNAQFVFWGFRVVFLLVILLTLFPGRNDDPETIRAVFFGFLAVWLLSETVFWYTFLTRAWVRDFGESFEYFTRFSHAEYRIAEITSLTILPTESVWEPVSLSLGKSNHCRDRIRFRVQGGPLLSWDMRYRELVNPVEPLLQRINDDYCRRISETINNRGSLDGKNWKFDQAGFHFPGREAVWETISADGLIVEPILNDICLWRLDAEEAMLLDEEKAKPIRRIPIRSENASVLLQFLQRAIPPREPEPHRPGVVGRHLVDIKPGLFLYFLFVAVLPFLGYAFASELGLIGLGIGVILEMVALFSLVMLFIPRRTMVYSRAVKRIWFQSAWVVYYDDVETFTHWMMTHYMNGIYTHTEIHLHMIPFPDRESKKWELSSHSCFSQARQFTILVGHLARAVARRLRSELDGKGEIAWVPGITLTRTDIQYRNPQAKSWELSKADIPYEKVRGVGAPGDGVYALVYDSGKEWEFRSLNLSMGAPNFAAGVVLFQELVNSSTAHKD